jgi:maltose O-acetyltransferase
VRDGPGQLFLNTVVASPLVNARLRRRLLRAAGIAAGRVTMEHGCRFDGTNVRFGDGTYVNSGCFFDSRARISLGDGVALGIGVRLVTSHHEFGPPERRAGPLTGRPIVLEEGAWVATGATVLGGVTIGRGAVVGAGALVTGDCEPNTLYLGVPAKAVRALGAG